MRTLIVAMAAFCAVLLNMSPVAAADRQVTSAVVQDEGSGARSTVTLTFAQPVKAHRLERRLTRTLGAPVSVVAKGRTARVTTGSPVGATPRLAAKDSDFGNTIIYCDRSYAFSDGNGRFTVQRQCGVRKAPWGYRLSSTVRNLCTSPVAELGMTWTRNGVKQPAMASHYVPDTYIFHGTFSVRAGDNVNYYDQLHCRHSIAGGGDVSIELYGTLRFRGRG